MPPFADVMTMIDATAKSLLGGELVVRAATLTTVHPVSGPHPCEGIVSEFDAGLIDGTLVRREDREIKLLIATLPDGVEPKPGDKIAIDGATYIVLGGVGRDAAKFQFICHGRK